MLFSGLEELPPDAILGIAQAFRADPYALKVDLGVGIYKDAHGKSPVLASVKSGERWLLESQASKSYLSSAGNPEFNAAIAELLLGPGHRALTDGRVRSIQTPGGTGALRVMADFLRTKYAATTVWLPDPTWATHQPIFAACGLTTRRYPYYDKASARLLFDDMAGLLGQARQNDVILLHGCCHNPTGTDLNNEQWGQIATILRQTGAVPIIDLAYQGFGDGLDEDAGPVRMLADALPEMLVASSCSKNFSLYRDRVGAITIITRDRADNTRTQEHVAKAIRSNYSMPPDHGAAVVAHILGNPDLRPVWEKEVGAMRARIRGMRETLSRELTGITGINHDFITRQKGMFTLLNLKPEDVSYLRHAHHIYMTSSGRINIAGLSEANVGRVAEGIAAAQSRAAA